MRVAFLTKREKVGVSEAIKFSKSIFTQLEIFSGGINDPFPKRLYRQQFEILISYISPWIVPNEVLKKTKKWNINFHPGPPEYPGIGCFNFAIFDSAKEFGATAHLMESKVDTGEIIGVARFPMGENETVESLSLETYSAMLSLYKDIISYVVDNHSVPECSEYWKREPYKRKELEDLATIKADMSKQEIDRRIRATYYPGKPAPFVQIAGYRFEYDPER